MPICFSNNRTVEGFTRDSVESEKSAFRAKCHSRNGMLFASNSIGGSFRSGRLFIQDEQDFSWLCDGYIAVIFIDVAFHSISRCFYWRFFFRWISRWILVVIFSRGEILANGVYVYVYVWICFCMYVCMYVSMYACMHVYVCVWWTVN